MTINTSIVDAPLLPHDNIREQRIVEALGNRPIVLVGMMGAGKTSLGKRLSARLNLPFQDADAEIELAAKMTVAEIFETHGEAYFRDGERRVVLRMVRDGAKVLATGGGAFINPETRAKIVETSLCIWLKADIDVLMRRLRRRTDRPLLQSGDLETTLRDLSLIRDPFYAQAHLTIVSGESSHEHVLESLICGLESHLKIGAPHS